MKCNTTARYRARNDLLRSMFNMTTWFCDAYASWQKGGIENVNGRLRRWLPRNLDIAVLDEQELQDAVFTANVTRRKYLGYKPRFQEMRADLGKTSKSDLLKPLHFTLESTAQSCALSCVEIDDVFLGCHDRYVLSVEPDRT